MLRQPIVSLLGNIDSGKSSIIEKVKGISITKSEAGGITQTIASFNVPIEIIQKICGNLLSTKNISLPGLVFIDLPGHAAFSNLRKRGGTLADIAIVVIDINEGILPQTLESIEILQEAKTPFIVALNKIDLINAWQKKSNSLIQNIKSQPESVQQSLDNKIYELVGKFYELGFNAERYDRVEDFTKTIALIPCSARSEEGLPELLMMLVGLAQKFLENSLETDTESPGQGTILEVKEEKGLGKTINAIIYNGKIKVNDQIVIGSLTAPIVTKIKAILVPENKSLKNIKEATAAIGVKILTPSSEDIIPGMPIKVANENLESIKEETQKEVQETTLEIDEEGIITKANSLGSLEALIHLLKEKNIKIKRASIGDITKKDIAEASSESNPLNKVILGFMVKNPMQTEIKVITNEVIYKLIEDLEAWKEEKSLELEKESLKDIIRPCKFKILSGCIFRVNNPAIVGVEILGGILKPNTPIMKDKYLTDIKGIQLEGKNIEQAEKGKQVAISMPNITAGRQINEEDILYTDLKESDFRTLKKLKKYLNSDEIEILKEISEIKRKENPMWEV